MAVRFPSEMVVAGLRVRADAGLEPGVRVTVLPRDALLVARSRLFRARRRGLDAETMIAELEDSTYESLT